MGDFSDRLEQHNADNPYPGASVHDEDRVMTPQEIIKLKRELMENPERLLKLASFIVTEMLTEDYERDAQMREEKGTCYGSNVPQDVEGRVTQAAYLGAHWAFGLVRSCLLPEDQWPEHSTSPGNYAAWLEDMDAQGIDSSRGIAAPITTAVLTS